MKLEVPRISVESSTVRGRAGQRRGWWDKTILSLEKSQSAASVRLVGRRTDYCDCGSSNIQDCQHKNSAGTGPEVGSLI